MKKMLKPEQMMRERFAKATGLPDLAPREAKEKKKELKKMEIKEPKRKY